MVNCEIADREGVTRIVGEHEITRIIHLPISTNLLPNEPVPSVSSTEAWNQFTVPSGARHHGPVDSYFATGRSTVRRYRLNFFTNR
jgi:hypothetical protein